MIRNWLAHDRLRRHAGLITAAWIAYWLILTGLLLAPKLPRSPIPLDARAMAAHFVAFALLAAGCVLSRQARRGDLTYRWLGLWCGVLVVYAALSELLQSRIGRHGDAWDWAANVAGVLAVMVVCRPRSRGAAGT